MTSPVFIAPGEHIQRSQTAYRRYTDQHGRVFESQADVRNGMPKEELRPIGHTPPWLPPMAYAVFQGIHDVTFRWDYGKLAAELGGIAAVYYADAGRIALDHNKPEPELGGPVDRSIRNVLGSPPLSPAIPLACEMGDPWILGVPGAQVNAPLKAVLEQKSANGKEVLEDIQRRLEAQQQGSGVVPVATIPARPEKVERARTINDLADEDPEPVTYRAFFAACRKRGMSAADAAAAWHEHKKLQAA